MFTTSSRSPLAWATAISALSLLVGANQMAAVYFPSLSVSIRTNSRLPYGASRPSWGSYKYDAISTRLFREMLLVAVVLWREMVFPWASITLPIGTTCVNDKCEASSGSHRRVA